MRALFHQRRSSDLKSDPKFKLIIAEKPDAARRIAAALGQKMISRPDRRELPLYEVERNGDRLKIMAATGHLYTLRQSGKGWDYPVLDMEWVPKYDTQKSTERNRAFIERFRELSQETESYIVATDFDVEGETIAYCILKYACGSDALKRAQRMKFSTLTDKELIEAYEHPLPQVNSRMAEAGETRHKVDWLFGINISRALMLALKRGTGRYRTLSTGRVQGPTLTFIADREVAIRSFVPTPYWVIDARTEIEGKSYPLQFSRGQIPARSEAEQIVDKCQGKEGIIGKIEKNLNVNQPPYPFDLGSLQKEAYRLFTFSPSRTLSIAERLYLAALISYPRTSSQKIPASLDSRSILESLSRIPNYHSLAKGLLTKEKLIPHQGKKEDPAHPPITPTGILPPHGALTGPEEKIFDLVVRRFMSVYGDDATSETIRATVLVGDEIFYLRGRKTILKGWLAFYEPYFKSKEILLPNITEGEILRCIECEAQERHTNPPPRFNASTLLSLMEEQGIGTKATRAEIIDTLVRRGYISGNQIKITDLGFAVVDVLRRCLPQVLSVEMTRNLEGNMEKIQSGELKEDEVLSSVICFLEPVLEEFKTKETAIGKELHNALQESTMESLIIGACPVCKTGELTIIRSRKTGKRFIGCTNYKNGTCSFSAPIPQAGTIQTTDKKCQTCGFPAVLVRFRGKRVWRLCINPKCESKSKRKTQVAD
jgi:DNA topoisomerase-1